MTQRTIFFISDHTGVTAETLGQAIGEDLDMLGGKSTEDLRKMREERFLTMAG